MFVSAAAGAQTEYLPRGHCPQIIDYTYYSICYDPQHRQASWVKHELNNESISGKQKRTNNYRFDPNLVDPVYSSDYRGSGYDRGHLLPAADMKLNYKAMNDTFYMTNMSPQVPNFNRRIWASIEMHLRNLVRVHGRAHVVTAGVLNSSLPTIASGVSVPRWYFKVAYFPESQITKAFLIENKTHANSAHPSDFLVTVDEVESLSGFDFYSELPDTLEVALESQVFRN